ncbi:unnamed protein product [Amaranthus hypochondriacus]
MNNLISPLTQSHFLFKFPSTQLKFKKPFFILHYKCFLYPKIAISISFRASRTVTSAASYNGWDDSRIWVDSDDSGESNIFKRFLISLGINDKKYAVTCLLGFVCALAISRVRVSSITVFPAFAVVFAVGYWFGFVKNRPHKDLSSNGSKKRVKDDSYRVYARKLKKLVEIFYGFDVKINVLKNDIKNAIEYERIDLGDLESYVKDVETLGGMILNARNLVEDCVHSTLVEVQEIRKKPNQNNRKKKENGDKGFDLFGFMGQSVEDSRADSKSSSTNFTRKNILSKNGVHQNRAAEAALEPVVSENAEIPYRETLSDSSRKNNMNGTNNQTKRILSRGETNRMETYMNKTKSFLYNDEYNYQNVRFSSDRRFSFNMSSHKEIRNWVVDDGMRRNPDFDSSMEFLIEEESLKNQRIFESSSEAYKCYEEGENVDLGSFSESISEERMNVEDELYFRKNKSEIENDLGSFSSSTISKDMFFDRYLRKANELLKQAKDCLKARNDGTYAEERFRESAELLGRAIAIKPLSLLAIGQLGNTYLLHGELKLKISRELRSLLYETADFGVERSNLLFLEDTIPSKDGIQNLLSSVCEECEALLVEAGRQYRMALSIDRNDVRALYNWGLALSFRAQLIADIGPVSTLS